MFKLLSELKYLCVLCLVLQLNCIFFFKNLRIFSYSVLGNKADNFNGSST